MIIFLITIIRCCAEEGIPQFLNIKYGSKVDLKFGFDDDWNQFNSFEISNDDFEIFWLNNKNNQFYSQTVFRSDSRDIANIIWEELLEKVGIV